MVEEGVKKGAEPKKTANIEVIDLSGSHDEDEETPTRKGKNDSFSGQKNESTAIVTGPNKEKFTYRFAGKESLFAYLKRVTPPELIPTVKMSWALGGIFLIVVIIAAFNFPLGSMLSGNVNIKIEIGWPFPFLVFDMVDVDASPLRMGPFLFDLFLYLLIAYAIDVILNYTWTGAKSMVEDRSAKPKTFRDKKPGTPAPMTEEQKQAQKEKEREDRKDSDELIKEAVEKQKTKSQSNRK